MELIVFPHDNLDRHHLKFYECVIIANFLRPDSTAVPSTWTRYLPIEPECSWKQSWDAVVMLFLLYTTFSVPYTLALVSDRDPKQPISIFDTYDIFLDTLFCIDIILSFLTAYTSQGVYEKRLSMIALHYIKTWFTLDFFGSVPFDKIVSAVLDGGEEFASTLKILKIARILKMVRAVRFLNKLKQLEEKVQTYCKCIRQPHQSEGLLAVKRLHLFCAGRFWSVKNVSQDLPLHIRHDFRRTSVGLRVCHDYRLGWRSGELDGSV